MIKIIGVRFREAGKIYYFSPGKRKISRGDQVIVETARGVEMGLRGRRHVAACAGQHLVEGRDVPGVVALGVGIRHVAGDRRLAHRQVTAVQRSKIEQVDACHADPSMPVTPSCPETTRCPGPAA